MPTLSAITPNQPLLLTSNWDATIHFQDFQITFVGGGVNLRREITRSAFLEEPIIEIAISEPGLTMYPQRCDHPLQRAWIAENVPQCGYCQPGQLMTAAALLAENPHPNAEEIDLAMAGNLCRCGTYQRIRRAISQTAGNGGGL